MPALVLVAAAALLLAPAWVRGLTPFWGDMTYIHHPWQAFIAQTLQAGQVPLWNPYLYLGMPQLANMQSAVLYPGQGPFFLFGFATGAALFQLVHYFLAGWFAFLWLRSLRLSKAAALGGGLLFAFSGVMLSRMPFLNHLSALSLLPAVLLFFRHPWPLALTLCMAFLAGYPPFLPGGVAVAWVIMRGWSWLPAGAAALALGAAQLVPGVELMRLSRRSGGVALDEMLKFGFAPADLLQWVSPALIESFQPAVEWWKCSYLGFAGFALAAIGLWRLKRAGLALAGVLLIILGDTNPLSAALWRHFTPLHFVRYPGNLAYLAVPVLALLCALGVQALPAKRRFWAMAAVFVELLVTAQGVTPLAPRRLFTTKGDLVRGLQDGLDGRRYLLSPLARETHAGRDLYDWKTRLYGLTNAPYKLRAAANFGEPLVPRANWELMDRLYSQPSAQRAADLAREVGVAAILVPGGEPWKVIEVEDPAILPRWPRDDRFLLEGETPFQTMIEVPEPRYPGWRAWVNGKPARVGLRDLLGYEVLVPAGPYIIEFKYEPWSFTLGVWLTLLSALGFLGACYNRLLCAAPTFR